MTAAERPEAATLEPLLSVRNLSVRFETEDGAVHAVRDVSWEVYPGEILGIVGESGSGKSVSVASTLGLLPTPPAVVSGGSVMFGGVDLLTLGDRRLREIRGKDIAMIFQDPMTAFNPVLTIGSQIAEALRVHDNTLSRSRAKAGAIELLELVRVPSPVERFDQFPHEYSGGMRQRAMIAMAIANRPKLLIADEPTTALDVTIQAQILDLILNLQHQLGTAVVLITHDLGVVAETAQRVVVMYAGRKVEEADVVDLFKRPMHPYTEGLLGSVPRLGILHGNEERKRGERPRLREIPGIVPALVDLPPGCTFAPRCPYADDQCRATYPPYEKKASGHWAACWHSDRIPEQAVAANG